MAKVLLATSLGPGKEYAHGMLATVLASLCGYEEALLLLDGVSAPEQLLGSAIAVSVPGPTVPMSIHGRLARMRSISRAFFLASDCTHLYWHDADMAPPLDIIPRLLAHELPIVNGFYLIRGRTETPTVAMVTRQLDDGALVDRIDVRDGMMSCVAYGHGCMLVDRLTMERTPYRDPQWYGQDGPGEDVQWCIDADRPIWVDTTLPVWHVDEDGTGIRPGLAAA